MWPSRENGGKTFLLLLSSFKLFLLIFCQSKMDIMDTLAFRLHCQGIMVLTINYLRRMISAKEHEHVFDNKFDERARVASVVYGVIMVKTYTVGIDAK